MDGVFVDLFEEVEKAFDILKAVESIFSFDIVLKFTPEEFLNLMGEAKMIIYVITQSYVLRDWAAVNLTGK